METIDFPITTVGLFWFQFSLKPIHGWLAAGCEILPTKRDFMGIPGTNVIG
jgi:hypothetical protein